VFVNGTDVCWKDTLWSRCRTDDLREPSEMRRVPGGPAGGAEIVSEPEGVETTRGGLEVADDIFARPGEIPQGFVCRLGNRDRGASTGAHQAGQLHRVTAVGLDAVTGLLRNQRRRHNPAVVPFFDEIAGEPVATGTGVLDQDQMLGLGWSLADEVINVTLAGADGTEIRALGSGLWSDVGHRDGLLMDISAHGERARLGHG
jgi:hypothetical protein